MSGKLNLKNHRSEMSPEKSIMLIESLLVKAGATNVSKTIVDKQIDGVVFEIPVNGMVLNFKLPSKVDLVYKRLSEGRKLTTQTMINNCKEQARRTAWKILYEWVQIQVSMIQIEQVEIMEVFLPYAYDREKNETYFEKIKATGFKQLQLTN